jgi:hypothetical protein
MRPAILQWKVMLVLVVVVVAAVSLGSALHSSQSSVRTFYVSGVNSGWTGYYTSMKNVPTLGFLPAHKTPLVRLRDWLDKHVWGGG